MSSGLDQVGSGKFYKLLSSCLNKARPFRAIRAHPKVVLCREVVLPYGIFCTECV